MERFYLLIFFIFFCISDVSSIIINEIELNPLEGSKGEEWVELYNDEKEDIDISGWEIYDGLSSITKRHTIPEDTIIEKDDFYIIEFTSSVLNNNGDFLILYDSEDNEVDRTDKLKEISKSSKTWQLCKDWVFLESTKNKDNDCEEEIPEEQKIYENNANNKTIEEINKNNTQATPEVIRLNPKVIKTDDNKERNNPFENKGDYAKYGLILFCILICVLYIAKQKRQNKEFE